MIIGDSGSYKTFYAIELAMSIATGKPFLGLHSVRQGAVAYVCAEGGGNVKKRFRASMKFHNICPNRNLLVLPRSYDLMTEEQTGQLISEIERHLKDNPPVAVVFDTFARNMRGDENAIKDTRLVLDNAARLRDRWKCSVIFVHHLGKDATRGARGHSNLRCDVDTVIRLEKYDQGIALVHSEKTKDGEHFADYLVDFPLVALTDDSGKPLRDKFGQPIDSLAARPSSTTVERAKRQKESDQATVQFAAWLKVVPATESDARTVKEMLTDFGPSERAMRDRLTQLGSAGHVAVLPETAGRRGGGAKYYRTATGNALVIGKEIGQ
jgi:hypothetical protein